MPIGEFAKRSRLSHKALRLYDTMGLLSPDFVDEGSSYRYYSEAQLEKAKLIGLLRQLEMPLNQIAEVLSLWCWSLEGDCALLADNRSQARDQAATRSHAEKLFARERRNDVRSFNERNTTVQTGHDSQQGSC